MATYTVANLQSKIGLKVNGSISDANWLVLINDAVREVISDVDPRSTKRKAALSPFLFNDVYDYSAPTDLKNQKIIDIKPQINREKSYEFELVSNEEFDKRKDTTEDIFTVTDDSLTRKLRISAPVEDDTLVVSRLDSTTSGGGTWTGFGDVTTSTLATDSDYYVKGSASLSWDINADGGTTAGIVNSTLDTFDITDYVANGSVFVWAWITSTTNLTNFIIRIGSDSSNYYTKTITTTNEGTSFVAGWNLLRFDFSSATQTGTVDPDACDYCAIYMTKAAGKVSENNYRFDHIMVKRGEFHYVEYYSKYPFQSSSGTWLVDCTATTDYVNAEAEEIRLILEKGRELANAYLNDEKGEQVARKNYNEMVNVYKQESPSEAKILTNSYR